MMRRTQQNLFLGIEKLRCQRWRTVLSIAIMVVGASACRERPAQPAEGYPKPGEMRLVAVTPLESPAPASPDGNLIVNGDFRNWWAGVMYPEGFRGAEDSEVMRITRGSEDGVIQEWLKDDTEEPVDRLFHTVVSGIRPDTLYLMEVEAVASEGAMAGISVYDWPDEEAESGDLLEWPEIIQVQAAPGEKQTLSRAFRSGRHTRIAIAAHASGNTEYPAMVKWISWRLTETDAAEDVAKPRRPPKFALSQPRPWSDELTVQSGEELTILGWYIADMPSRVDYVLNGERFDAEYYPRPDVDNNYPEYTYRSGWRVVLQTAVLAPSNTLSIRFNGEERYSATILVE
ncbi:MAG TPA: hypothetical protein ENN65_03370 [Candidatus Hydrogenedentes bacterium]|nr:hypothetical protein [Candidatus Hydrogenedentota bacterium]